MRNPLPTLLLLSALAAVAAPALAADDVTIFRCVDAKGRLSLRDSPCEKGEQQQVRTMIRPKDAPPRPAPAPATIVTAPAYPPTQVIVKHPPRPMYECVTRENTRYISDSPEGNPRRVPTWLTDRPAFDVIRTYEPPRLNVSVNNGHTSGSYSSGGYHDTIVTGWPGETWVRDACHPLPEIEVCARLRDRRDELRRRFSIAQPSERAVLGREERGINARLDQDCS